MPSISKLDGYAKNTILHRVKSFEIPSLLSEVKENTETELLAVLGSTIQYTY